MGFPNQLRLWGIGGVGMSALAQHLHALGHTLSGYDREPSPFTALLEGLGIPIDYTARPEPMEAIEGIIYTPAIPEDFLEWRWVRQRNLPVWRRAQALAESVAPFQVVATAGAHGKTTTAAILTWLLHAVGDTPYSFVGGLMRNFQRNYVAGTTTLAVVEADEYDRALLLLEPAYAILQSLDPDHLEIYGSAEALRATYRTFVEKVKHLVVAPAGLPDLGRPLLRYSLQAYHREGEWTYFTYAWEGRRREAAWHQIGRHLAENAAAALTLLEALGYPKDRLLAALPAFAGVERRMEIYTLPEKQIVVSDYAHHPTEVRRTLEALRESFPRYRLFVFFQPHLYSRTAFFAPEFGAALSLADKVILLPIYAARETSTGEVSHKWISQHLSVDFAELLPLETEMRALLTRYKSPERPTIWAFLGAGDIYKLAELATRILTTK
ncbi:MAG: Mur ligase domain-containing protein [Bacteroidia bacterium]|nr:Mur ligase domain-containing protein [Bacteroidia bacterium]MDW8088264.1 cyanophycin synthetase [Bacteroidia bacterium]